MTLESFDIIVLGAGPAGMFAALRAADLGARTALLSSGECGGLAANDGPVPVRALAYAARLLQQTRQMSRYGICATDSVLRYDRLQARVREIVYDVRARTTLRERIDALGVIVHDELGAARFVDPHTIETERGPRLRAEKLIICTGGVSRRLAVPGFEFTSTHSDAWKLSAIPPSMLIIGGGDTAVQLASVFRAFGTEVQLFEQGPRILPSADEAVATAVTSGLRASGVVVHERFGAVTSFEKTTDGVRINFRCGDELRAAEAALAVVAIGWMADTAYLNLAEAGVEVDARGSVKVDRFLRTSAPHIFAAGDVTGRLMLVPAAIEDGFVAASNAVQGATHPLRDRVNPAGSFSDPEYAQVGLTEARAREAHDIVAAVAPFDSTVRANIEGRTSGFCKLIADRQSYQILGCHVVGERAVEIAQSAAIAIAARMPVDELARVAVSFPTYAEVLVHAAIRAAVELDLPLTGQAAYLGVS